MKSKRVTIIGGGVIGLTTAWELVSRGYTVQVLERREDVARETSFANGAMHHASSPEPWNAPGVYKHLFASVFDPYSAMKLRLYAIPSLMKWGIKFLRNSNAAHHRYAADASYQLSAWSTAETLKLKEELDLEYCSNSVGTMKIFRDKKAMPITMEFAKILESKGLRFEILDPQGAVDKEPQLANIKADFSGALYFPGDESGDPYLFSQALSKHIHQAGGEIILDTQVERIETRAGKVTGVMTRNGLLESDTVILAAGNQSQALARQVSVSLCMAPVKGYSATVDARELSDRPKIPVIDETMHAAVNPLGDRLRVTGTAEFAGFDTRMRQERIDNLFKLFKGLYPHIYRQIDPASASLWTAFRPMSADGLPFIGQAGPEGLYINTGHGHLGWTQAMGSAKLISDCLENKKPEIQSAPFYPAR